MHPDDAVVRLADGRQNVAADRRNQNFAVVVIGMIAADLRPAGSGKETFGLFARQFFVLCRKLLCTARKSALFGTQSV